jgi:DNA-binding IclR family transcriptional regulator
MGADEANSGARTVGRVLKLLELVAEQRKPIRLVDISSALDMPASSAHVLAKQLVKYDYIRSDEDKRYVQSTGLVALASRVMGNTQLVTVARPFIEALSHDTGESIYLGLRTALGIVYVDSIEGNAGLVARTPLGSLRSAHASSAGRVFLAFAVPEDKISSFLGKGPLHAYTDQTPTDRSELKRLVEQIRRDGYAVNEQALTEKVCGVSAPLFGASGRFLGTITLSAPDTRFQQKKDQFIAKAVECARSISLASGQIEKAKS